MRTLIEILEGVRDNVKKPEGEEAYYALVSLDFIFQLLCERFSIITNKVSGIDSETDAIISNTMTTILGGLQTSPDKYMENFMPGTPLYDEDRKKVKEYAEKILKQAEEFAAQLTQSLDSEEAKKLKDQDKLN